MAHPGFSACWLFLTVALLFTFGAAEQASCSSMKFPAGRSFHLCTSLPVLDASLHWTYHPESGTADVAFRAPSSSKGWVAWGINTERPNSIVGSSVFIASQDANGVVSVLPTFLESTTPSLTPGNLRFNVSSAPAAEYSAGVYTIYATVVLPGNSTQQNIVWQTGPLVNGQIASHPALGNTARLLHRSVVSNSGPRLLHRSIASNSGPRLLHRPVGSNSGPKLLRRPIGGSNSGPKLLHRPIGWSNFSPMLSHSNIGSNSRRLLQHRSVGSNPVLFHHNIGSNTRRLLQHRNVGSNPVLFHRNIESNSRRLLQHRNTGSMLFQGSTGSSTRRLLQHRCVGSNPMLLHRNPGVNSRPLLRNPEPKLQNTLRLDFLSDGSQIKGGASNSKLSPGSCTGDGRLIGDLASPLGPWCGGH